jgi:hypothetical protein
LILTIGGRSTLVPDPSAGNEAMLRAYLALVAEVRGTPLGSGIELRHDDVVVLAEFLDLADGDLEAHLVNLLGVSANDAADVHRRIRKHRAITAAATLSVGGFLLLGAKTLPSNPTPAPPEPIVHTVSASPDPTTTITTTTVAIAPLPEAPSPSSYALAATPDVEIGDALVIERGQQPADPNTKIGDSVTYER